jgi:hypothetical protein
MNCSLSGVPSAQRLAVRTSRWSRPLAHWTVRCAHAEETVVTDSLVGGAIYTPSTHHIECLAAHIDDYTLLEHCKLHKA